MVRDLQRQNVESAGQVGYVQPVEERDEQLQLLLAAPNEGQEDRTEGDGGKLPPLWSSAAPGGVLAVIVHISY